MEMQNIPKEDWDNQLREFAKKHKELSQQLENNKSVIDEVLKIKAQAKEALDNGDLVETERLIDLAIETETDHIKANLISLSDSFAEKAH